MRSGKLLSFFPHEYNHPTEKHVGYKLDKLEACIGSHHGNNACLIGCFFCLFDSLDLYRPQLAIRVKDGSEMHEAYQQGAFSGHVRSFPYRRNVATNAFTINLWPWFERLFDVVDTDVSIGELPFQKKQTRKSLRISPAFRPPFSTRALVCHTELLHCATSFRHTSIPIESERRGGDRATIHESRWRPCSVSSSD